MMYFIPNVATWRDELISEHKLGHAAVGSPSWIHVMGGPDGANGVVVSWSRDEPRIGYYPDRQTWHNATAFGGYWIGINNGIQQLPEDFARDTLIPGHDVVMGDGRAWTIPIARAFPVGTRLPTRFALNASGEVVERVTEAHLALSAHADAVFRSLCDTGGISMDKAEARKAVACAISANYRIAEPEALALGLLTTDAMLDVLLALVDFPTWERERDAMDTQKKTGDPAPIAPDTANFSNGGGVI